MQGLRVFWGIMKHYAGKNFKKSCFHRLTAKVGLKNKDIRTVKIGKISGANPPLLAFVGMTKKTGFLVIFLLTLFVNTLKYTIVSQQANINRQ
jgi:hypothetical protein